MRALIGLSRDTCLSQIWDKHVYAEFGIVVIPGRLIYWRPASTFVSFKSISVTVPLRPPVSIRISPSKLSNSPPISSTA